MKKLVLEHLNEEKDRSGRSYAVIGEKCHMSISKLSRIFTGQVDPTVSDINDILSLGLDSDPAKLWSRCGMREYDDSAEIGYKGAAVLIQEHNAQIAALQDSFNAALAAIKETHVEDLKQRDDRYETAVKYLKTDFVEAKSNLQAALKSVKWWRAVAIGVLSVVVFMTVYLIIDFSDLDTGLSNMIMRMIKAGLI